MVVLIALVVAVGFGLATDYEVFLVSRMVEARARGMSTAEAIRIGTATTGRLITAAALVLAVVAGSFVFSDLVMMKYLAFGLMAALLLDATVVRMFLVPSVMKLLGDDCWWAPRWMRRLQNRIGLGEIHLPDERKRPVVAGRSGRPPVAAGPPVARHRVHRTTPRTPADGARGRPTGCATAPDRTRPPAPDAPRPPAPRECRTGTARAQRGADDPLLGPAEPADRADARLAAPARSAAAARGDDREIESWLSDLRGGKTGDPRRRHPPAAVGRTRPGRCRSRADSRRASRPPNPTDATTAIPTAPREEQGLRHRHREAERRGWRRRRDPRPRRAPAAGSVRPGSAAPRGPASSREFASRS